MNKLLLILSLLVFFITCKKPYNPPVLQAPNNFLVVDGFINLNTNGVTAIVLSRSRNLSDTVISIPELRAQVFIESNSGTSYSLVDFSNSGVYKSFNLNLNPANQYRLKIITSDNH